MRRALFGGSFDPPHLGHLAFAQAALQALDPAGLVWLPTGRQWQKERAGKPLTRATHRLAMLALLTAGEPRFSIDAREPQRAGMSFTVDTLRELHAEQPGVEWLMLLGQDQYANLHTWYQVEQVLQLATIVAVPRAGQAVRASTLLPSHRLEVLALPDTPISSTAVRAAAAAGEDLAPLVGTAVAGYIASHRLYGTP